MRDVNDSSPTLTPAPPPPPEAPRRDHRVPQGTYELGMYLFLAALGMLFAATMLGYVLLRFSKTRTVVNPTTKIIDQAPTAPPLGSLHLPAGLWFSTLVILASSVTIHLALQNVRRERQQKFRTALVATLVLSVLFLLVQLPSLVTLLVEHFRAGDSNTMLGLIFVLIVLHALHVVGGIVPLGVVTYRAGQGKYDHEEHRPVKSVAMYWHFLDAVWIVMFTLLIATR